jgi:SRSO17 transposase
MSAEIVSEICPPPEWNLTAEDIHQMAVELEQFYQIFKPGFERRDQAAHGWVYLKGLLSDLPRKVTERIALRFGTCVRSLQHFIGQSPWEWERLLERQQALVVETLGEADGVVLVDESGMPKQGDHSVGVARQYCGSLGKVANAQVGVYLGYASRKGHSFLDGRLFLPEPWFASEYQELRQACGVPPEQGYQTKPEIGLELLQNALQRGALPFQWVAADELYGDSPHFRDGIAALHKWFFVEVRCTTGLWLERPEVFTQMTKEGIFTVRVGGNYIADFDLAIVNNNSVNEQFNQLAALSKVKRIQGWLNFPAKVLDVLSQLEQVELLLGLRLQLAQLLGQAAVRLG